MGWFFYSKTTCILILIPFILSALTSEVLLRGLLILRFGVLGWSPVLDDADTCLLLFPGSTGLGPRSAFQWLSKPFKARAKVNPLKIAGQTLFALCYLYKLIFFLLAGSTIPPVLRFTLLVGHVCVVWLRAAPISPSQFPMESMGSEPGQLPLAVNCKINISLKHRAS